MTQLLLEGDWLEFVRQLLPPDLVAMMEKGELTTEKMSEGKKFNPSSQYQCQGCEAKRKKDYRG